MKRFECGTVVDGCDGVVTGDTEDEVLQAAAQLHVVDGPGVRLGRLDDLVVGLAAEGARRHHRRLINPRDPASAARPSCPSLA